MGSAEIGAGQFAAFEQTSNTLFGNPENPRRLPHRKMFLLWLVEGNFEPAHILTQHI
jgi:hypothetical protein